MNNFFDIKYFVLSIIVFAIGFYNHEQLPILLMIYFCYNAVKGNNRFLVIINFFIAMLFSLPILEINRNSKILISFWINEMFNFSLRDYLINTNINNYGNQLGSFLNLILFGYKGIEINALYSQIVNVSLLHLFVISGIHISFLSFIIKKIFIKKWLCYPISFILLFFVCYINNFNIGSFRAFLFFIMSVFKFRDKNIKMWLSIIIIFLFAPQSLSLFSFQMTYISLLVLHINFKWNKKLLLNSLLLSVFINLYLLPYISNMTQKFSLFGFLYSYIFSPFVLTNYFVALFIFWVPSYDILNFFYNIFVEMIKLSEVINVVIDVSKIPPFYFPLYLSAIWIINSLFYKFNDNKMWKK